MVCLRVKATLRFRQLFCTNVFFFLLQYFAIDNLVMTFPVIIPYVRMGRKVIIYLQFNASRTFAIMVIKFTFVLPKQCFNVLYFFLILILFHNYFIVLFLNVYKAISYSLENHKIMNSIRLSIILNYLIYII